MATLTQTMFEELQAKRQAVDLDHPEESGFRNHLGASVLGNNCKRQVWFNFRHAKLVKHEPRIIRLFDRGHREEARFTAMLRSIGIELYEVNPDTGKQFRTNFAEGHGGGSCDGMGINFPEYPNEWCLVEYKTHGEKSFLVLLKSGVKVAKPVHYVQMVIYMYKFKLKRCLYMAVNKNTDEIHTEWVEEDTELAERCMTVADEVVFGDHVPDRVSDSSAYFECRFCDYRSLCFHKGEEPHVNCRTCKYVKPEHGGAWWCTAGCEEMLPAELIPDTQKPCSNYEKHEVFVCPKDIKINLVLK